MLAAAASIYTRPTRIKWCILARWAILRELKNLILNVFFLPFSPGTDKRLDSNPRSQDELTCALPLRSNDTSIKLTCVMKYLPGFGDSFWCSLDHIGLTHHLIYLKHLSNASGILYLKTFPSMCMMLSWYHETNTDSEDI